jgi:ABC-type tungstate transport system permease subunit
MQLELNQISRDWIILHKGRTFYVNYTDSDGQTLVLLNRDNWEIWEDMGERTELLNVYGFSTDTPQQRKAIGKNVRLANELIKFCVKNWDNKFMQNVKKDMEQLISVP